jgi:murein DD-endopeptidase MepM/ murein hydrolase activator NlpD
MPLFEAPIGPQPERNAGIFWPSAWIDSNKFEALYEVRTGVWANHTGADLNLKLGEDENAPVFAMGDGVVTYAKRYPDPKVWGGLIVIYHGVVDKKVLYSRYAHVNGIAVAKNDKVVKGQKIAQIGGRELGFDPHLHFDISTTSALDGDDKEAGFWPGTDLNLLRKHFVNPREWLHSHRSMSAESKPGSEVNVDAHTAEWIVTHTDGVDIRKNHGIAAEIVQTLTKGARLMLTDEGMGIEDDFLWRQIIAGDFDGCWVAVQKEKENETAIYLERA